MDVKGWKWPLWSLYLEAPLGKDGWELVSSLDTNYAEGGSAQVVSRCDQSVRA